MCRGEGVCLARELDAGLAQTGASEGSAAPGGEETEASFSHFVGEPNHPRAEGPVQLDPDRARMHVDCDCSCCLPWTY